MLTRDYKRKQARLSTGWRDAHHMLSIRVQTQKPRNIAEELNGFIDLDRRRHDTSTSVTRLMITAV